MLETPFRQKLRRNTGSRLFGLTNDGKILYGLLNACSTPSMSVENRRDKLFALPAPAAHVPTVPSGRILRCNVNDLKRITCFMP